MCDDMLSLIWNQKSIDQRMVSGVSKSIRSMVEKRKQKLFKINLHACESEYFMFGELLQMVPKWNYTTIYFDGAEWYIDDCYLGN